MKFKLIFGLFNFVILISFLLVGLLPVFAIGPEYAFIFWTDNWPLAGAFFLILIVLNGYFIANWQLFNKLESQDWDGLTGYLEQRVFHQSKLSAQNVRILINAYVVRARPERVHELEQHLKSRKERLVRKFGLEFGVSHLLSGESDRIVSFFDDLRGRVRGSRREWAEWNYAFGLTLDQRLSDARRVLVRLASGAKDKIVRALSLYLLSNFSGTDDEVASVLNSGRSELLRVFPTRDKWRRYVEKHGSELQVLAVSRIIEEAAQWLYGDSGSKPGSDEAAGNTSTSGDKTDNEQSTS